jgi:hypothetical protein
MPAELPEYGPMVQTVMAAWGARAGGGSTSEQIAAGIYEAATDGKKQLRYVLGDDAKQLYEMRKQAGDDAFMVGMKQQMLG